MSDATNVDTRQVRDETECRDLIRLLIKELSPIPTSDHPDEARLVDDLGYHSLALLELAFALEDEFGLQPIDEQTARKILTVRDVGDHVVSELRSTGKFAHR
jgi:acyl carrier protein